MELLIFWIIMAAICAIIARSKGLSGTAYFLGGLILWPIVLVVALVKPRKAAQARPQPDGIVGGAPFWLVGKGRNASVEALIDGHMIQFRSKEALVSFLETKSRQIGATQ